MTRLSSVRRALVPLFGALTAACAAPGMPDGSAGPDVAPHDAAAVMDVAVEAAMMDVAPTGTDVPMPTPDARADAAMDAADGGAMGHGRVYPRHTNIVSTTFWVGEIFNASLSDGSQICSTYDSDWALRHTGINLGTVPASASGCPGAHWGGCDGRASGTTYANFRCATEARTAANDYFPTTGSRPLQNPFYLDLPFDDVNDATAYGERCATIPWATDAGYAGHCTDANFSYMKNRWVRITGPGGGTCYGQIEDAGPSSGSLYHDAAYVFGSTDARPVNRMFSGDHTQGAGMDVSPALNGCLGFADLDGDDDHVAWQFVDDVDVPAGPWRDVVTTSGVAE